MLPVFLYYRLHHFFERHHNGHIEAYLVLARHKAALDENYDLAAGYRLKLLGRELVALDVFPHFVFVAHILGQPRQIDQQDARHWRAEGRFVRAIAL